MIIRSGNYSIEKTPPDINVPGSVAFYGAWFMGDKIPCLGTLAHCKQAAESHLMRAER